MKKQRKALRFRKGGLLSLAMVPMLLAPYNGIARLSGARAADVSERVLYVAENGNDYTGNG
ncbi:MAG: hypothetical protein II762_02515, partial [Ruminococcus sp.]|nr:hypothetical protein [Ruminococcus sp.]